MNCISIVNSINENYNYDNYASVVSRYYEHKYCIKYSNCEVNLDQCISFHSNKICLISLAKNHTIIKCKKTIKEINTETDINTIGLSRSKKGALRLQPNSILCNIICTDNTTYPVYSCLKGKLIEINDNLFDNPQLIVDKPLGDGFIAIILPLFHNYNEMKDSMLTKADYLKHVDELQQL